MLNSFNITSIITILVCLFASMTVHEFMHAYVGLKLGDDTAMEKGRVSFNPLHHIDPIMTLVLPLLTLILFHSPILAAKPVPFDSRRLKFGDYGVALLALAGPLSNLVLAFVGAVILHIVAVNTFISQADILFVQLNVALAVFNIIPIPPLDGSRVLYAFAPEPVQELMQQIEPFGFFIIIALVLWGGASNVLSYLDSSVLNLLP